MKALLKKKLTSQSGVSIIYALLLFAICALAGTMIISSAVATSGRMADRASMDERYYKTISAANILADEINGYKTWIRRTKNKDGSYLFEYKVGDDYVELEEGASIDFLTSRIFEMIGTTDNSQAMFEADLYSEEMSETPAKYELSFASTSGTESYVVPIEVVTGKGLMQITLGIDDYNLLMTFTPEINETRIYDNGTQTKEAEITWNLVNIEKVFAEVSDD